MKIGPEDKSASPLRRWGVPLSVAAGVTAVSVAAVAAFGATGQAKPRVAEPGRSGEGRTSAPSPTPSTSRGSTSGGTESQSSPDAFTIPNATTTPIAPGTVSKILSSCLGADASRYHAVIAVRTPVVSDNSDGVVVAVDSADQYVQCVSKGDKGSSQDSPPTFINNRLWGTGRFIEYFDSTREPAGKGQYLMVGAGHYTTGIAKITVSYGQQPKEYPAVMAGGAFVYAATLHPDTLPGPHYAGPSPYIHAYDASGKEIYNQTKDPTFTSEQ
ncbi:MULTISPECIES: hypothetical protein [unclassified Streptomyces]|uniref:hypothetical protein n=1 Tax=unclassified Streptomyces TaxID=2593676 RepID=UPI003447E965